MILSRTYSQKGDIPNGAEQLYRKQGSIFVLSGASRDFDAVNPWEAANWNITEQGKFVAAYGMPFATAFAKIAGSSVGASKPAAMPIPDRNFTVVVQRREIGGAAAGSSSSGGLPTALATKV